MQKYTNNFFDFPLEWLRRPQIDCDKEAPAEVLNKKLKMNKNVLFGSPLDINIYFYTNINGAREATIYSKMVTSLQQE
jgi:hypothetical protein